MMNSVTRNRRKPHPACAMPIHAMPMHSTYLSHSGFSGGRVPAGDGDGVAVSDGVAATDATVVAVLVGACGLGVRDAVLVAVVAAAAAAGGGDGDGVVSTVVVAAAAAAGHCSALHTAGLRHCSSSSNPIVSVAVVRCATRGGGVGCPRHRTWAATVTNGVAAIAAATPLRAQPTDQIQRWRLCCYVTKGATWVITVSCLVPPAAAPCTLLCGAVRHSDPRV